MLKRALEKAHTPSLTFSWLHLGDLIQPRGRLVNLLGISQGARL